MDKISSGSSIINELLQGGYEKNIITTIYGPAGSGKTNLCLMAGICSVLNKKKVIFIDTEGGFSIERVKQLCPGYQDILDKIMIFNPTTFDEQKKVFSKLKYIVNDKVGLIIVDSIAMLYRIELGKNEEVYEVNRELGRQISYLSEVTRKKNIPVLLTNQVYANFEDKHKVNMVGGDILKYGSKCLIELQITPNNNRRAILKKHRSLPEEKEAEFKIVERGIKKIKEGKGFRLF